MRFLLKIFVLIQFFPATVVFAQQWESFSVPNDPVSAPGILRTVQQNVYIACYNGLYRSKDGGMHWQRIRQYTPQDGYRYFEVNYENNQLYYSQELDSSSQWSLYTSSDLGDTWTKIGNLRADLRAFIGDTLYGVYFVDGLTISSKWGNNPWKQLSNWPDDESGRVFSVKATGQELWVAAEKGIYHSLDAGYNWEFLHPLDNLPPFGIYDRVNLEIRQGEIVVVNEYANKMYFSKDQGENWQETLWEGAKLSNSGQNLFFTNLEGTKLFRFDGGDVTNWTEVPLNAQSDIQLDGVGEFNNTLWLGSQSFGVLHKPADANKWLTANGDMNTEDFDDLIFFDGHIFERNNIETFSADNGLTWTQPLDNRYPLNSWQNGDYNYNLTQTGTSTYIARCLRNNRFEWELYKSLPMRIMGMKAIGDTIVGYHSHVPSKIIQSFDNGQTFNVLPIAFQPSTIMSTSKGKFYLTGDQSLYRSVDFGTSWQPIYTFPFNLSSLQYRWYVVQDVLFLSDEPGKKVWFSTDEGQTFNILPTPQNPAGIYYFMRAANDLLALVLGDGLLYFSQDLGQTWVSVAMESINVGSFYRESWGFGNNTIFTDKRQKLRLDGKRQITGKVFLDVNGNGQFDFGDKGLNGMIAKAAESGAFANSYNMGDFTTLLGTDADELSITNVPTNFTVTPTNVTIPAGTDMVPLAAFAIKPIGTVNDAVVTLTATNAFKAGFNNTLFVDVKNAGTIPSSGQLKLVLSPLVSVLSTVPAADAHIGDTLVWLYNNLALLSNWQVQVAVRTAVVAPGAPLALRAEVLNGIDAVAANNTAILNEIVVASYDPNDKSVSEVSVPVDESDGGSLVYTVRFQNLGNAATDFINVRDTLSDALDVSSIQVLSSSHPLDWRLEEGRILVFRFSPIQLTPITEDTLRSQGFVKFAVKLKSGLEVGDEIANTAHIYFDFNPAIVTNTVVTSIAVVSTFEPSKRAPMLEIFPNPALDNATILVPDLATANKGRLEIFTAAGQLIQAEWVKGNRQEIVLNGFASGVYWCRWQADGHIYWGKLLVQR